MGASKTSAYTLFVAPPGVNSTIAINSSKDSAMPHRQTLRRATASLAIGALVILGACADSSSVAPESAAPTIHAPASFARVGSSIVFRVNNADGITQQIGDHILYLQPNAICDLAHSGYGSSTWDDDCRAQKGWVTITATIFKGPSGEPYIDFQPAMRFSPKKQAYLFLRVNRTNADAQMQRLLVKYCNDLGYCIDESLNDPSLKPFRLDDYSVVGRRVKHFSGYVLAFEECPEGGCTQDNGMLRKSGYMVASGEDVVSDLIRAGVFDKRGGR
jgi:hypothetical protein